MGFFFRLQEKIVKFDFFFARPNNLAIKTEKPVQLAQKYFGKLLDFSQ